MTAADRERILDRLAHALPNGREECVVNLGRADIEHLRELVRRDGVLAQYLTGREKKP